MEQNIGVLRDGRIGMGVFPEVLVDGVKGGLEGGFICSKGVLFGL